MKTARRTVVLVVLIAAAAMAQNREIAATVTYVAAGQVYVSAGRSQGVTDSASAVVRREETIVTTLRLSAVSSRSSSWTSDSAIGSVRVGDAVIIRVPASGTVTETPPDTTGAPTAPTILRSTYRRPLRPSSSSAIDVVGRIGLQTIAQMYDDRGQNFLQNGLLISARARARDLPLKLDLYANVRDVTRGVARPFSSTSSSATRIYRAALEYDDGRNTATFGRFTLMSAPTVGVLDGLAVSRRWGDVTTGLGLGVSPESDLQGTDPLRKRLFLFASYQPSQWASTTVSAAYAKTWYRGASEREMVNATGGVALSDRISLWASTDVELRMTESGSHRLDPSLSLLLVTASWRVTDRLSLTGGVDASRSVLPYSFARSIPDSMMDRSTRSGVTASASLMLPYGMSLSANVTPRMQAGAFNGDYAAATTVSAYDIFRSGVGFRVQGLLNRSQMSTGQGYGLTASMRAWTVEWSVRAQQIRYRLLAGAARTVGTTVGLDALLPLVDRLSWMLSLDMVRGFGSASRSAYSELSWRF